MALGDVTDISGIPYLDSSQLAGRFIPSVLFHDENWRMWLQLEKGQFVETHGWPAEALYLGRKPEQPTDFCSSYLTFMGQRANFTKLMPLFTAVQDDFFNLSAALAKLDLISESENNGRGGAHRMAATEVEYILLLCRSLFDLLQEVVAKLWLEITMVAPSPKKRALKKTFSDMTLHGNALRSAEQIADQFVLPSIIADCYVRHSPLFLKIREFRDSLVHRGYQVQTIFSGDDGFRITKRLGPFQNLNIWYDDEVAPNDLVPLKPALGLLIHGTIGALEDFADTLTSCIQFPNPTAPGMSLYMRGYFNKALVEALEDAAQRRREGKSLVA